MLHNYYKMLHNSHIF